MNVMRASKPGSEPGEWKFFRQGEGSRCGWGCGRAGLSTVVSVMIRMSYDELACCERLRVREGEVLTSLKDLRLIPCPPTIDLAVS